MAERPRTTPIAQLFQNLIAERSTSPDLALTEVPNDQQLNRRNFLLASMTGAAGILGFTSCAQAQPPEHQSRSMDTLWPRNSTPFVLSPGFSLDKGEANIPDRGGLPRDVYDESFNLVWRALRSQVSFKPGEPMRVQHARLMKDLRGEVVDHLDYKPCESHQILLKTAAVDVFMLCCMRQGAKSDHILKIAQSWTGPQSESVGSVFLGSNVIDSGLGDAYFRGDVLQGGCVPFTQITLGLYHLCGVPYCRMEGVYFRDSLGDKFDFDHVQHNSKTFDGDGRSHALVSYIVPTAKGAKLKPSERRGRSNFATLYTDALWGGTPTTYSPEARKKLNVFPSPEYIGVGRTGDFALLWLSMMMVHQDGNTSPTRPNGFFEVQDPSGKLKFADGRQLSKLDFTAAGSQLEKDLREFNKRNEDGRM